MAESRPVGAAEELCPAGGKAVRRIAEVEVLVVDPEIDILVCLRGARGCTTGERNMQRRGVSRTGYWTWLSLS